jgi:hypothetical protein
VFHFLSPRNDGEVIARAVFKKALLADRSNSSFSLGMVCDRCEEKLGLARCEMRGELYHVAGSANKNISDSVVGHLQLAIAAGLAYRQSEHL